MSNYSLTYFWFYCFQSELFQDDLYPDTLADTPGMSAEEWANGKEGEPVLVCILNVLCIIHIYNASNT